MTKNISVVLSDDKYTHIPLKSGDKLPTRSIPVSAESNNNLIIKPDGLFKAENTGLSTVAHDYTLDGTGQNDKPLSVHISSLEENIIKVYLQEDPGGGLYLPGRTLISSIEHNNSINGDGINDKLGIRISNKAGNSLKLVDQPIINRGGLFTKPTETIKCASVGGPVICEGPDTPGAETACGKFGTGVYWKKKIMLREASSGDNNILVFPDLISVPCKSDETPVPYQLLINYPTIKPGNTPHIYLLLICTEIPTHTINLINRHKAEIKRGVAITTPTGLDDIYSASNPGSGPIYILRYMYGA